VARSPPGPSGRPRRANLPIEGSSDNDSTAELTILLLDVTGALGIGDFAL
jgi:hypothetical protein